jgi:hypothetical protein
MWIAVMPHTQGPGAGANRNLEVLDFFHNPHLKLALVIRGYRSG